MEAQLRCPNGAVVTLDLDETSQALRLTVDAEGIKASALLHERSAHSLRALLMTMMEGAMPWAKVSR